ncbi:Succinate-CoA ligase (ADP-forming) [Acididesulfobacillus acetoxydans]|uniref:Succinate--CoA ligase [ADP-forming] subunit beta n=1 Tax=Acididesulfobacillus acetoxydans TaxID=1561005 RepID=A0A8S0WFY4_9FIRM|nr:ADP-forming succinate--CoA ligase subunit beta [Acididesulfobacillus acetoxydans]CAA7601442.1 Succinate-CoA ligase (ADP-forming) [Acididesulfobacillus acetoxydans]CEJ08873.1 Succinyl-CoA ligase [ADP-forming] subunit beta [Acididesulfobacillus acetoxydans]
MKMFEYMGKELFGQYGLPIPRGKMVTTPEAAAAAAREIGGSVVVKSQVLSGKRGKSGGIKFADNPEEAKATAGELLGLTIQGLRVEALLVEEKLKIDKELYISLAIDGAAKQPVLIASAQGGMEIEEVSEEHLVKTHIDPELGMQDFIAREVVRRMGVPRTSPHHQELVKLIKTLYKIFTEKDAELVEINPLVFSGDRVIAADAKVTVDEEALYRQPGLLQVTERTSAEEAAHALGLSFVELDGDIGVMANGAGITMATLDTLAFYGGKAANFLDAGGGTGEEGTAKALELILSRNPKSIFINIFGGITRCDDVARAFASVKKKRGIPVPVVVRLVGTNQEQGRAILREVGIEAYDFMQDAAQKAVELARS